MCLEEGEAGSESALQPGSGPCWGEGARHHCSWIARAVEWGYTPQKSVPCKIGQAGNAQEAEQLGLGRAKPFPVAT